MPVSTSSAPIVFSTIGKIAAEAREEFREWLDRESGGEKRQAQPERIDRKQARPFRDRRLRRGDCEDDRQIGPMHGVQPNAKASPIT